MIADKIIAGERLKLDDDLKFLLTIPLEDLQTGAALIQKKFFGSHIDLCTIINGKSGRCSENCKYCAQSARHKTGINEYDFLPTEEILRTIAIFRYINPTVNIRFAAGRKFLPDKGALAFLHGASAAITGNMLTTTNNNVEADLKLLAELGLTNKF